MPALLPATRPVLEARISDYPEVELSKWEIVHGGNGGLLRR